MDGILSALIIVGIIALLWYLFTTLKWPVIPLAITLSILLIMGVVWAMKHPFIHI